MRFGKIRAGLVGLGDMGTGHLEALKLFPKVEIAALCDTNRSRLHAAQKRLPKKIAAFTSYEDLLDYKNLDAVFVSVPNYLHAPIGFAVLKSGRHLFLEKPMAHNAGDAKKLLAAAKKTDLVFQVGHVYRHSPFYHAMADWVDDGAVGKPMMLWCHEFREPFPQRDWFYDRKKSGGTFVEKNCHHFDLFNWFADDRPKKVAAFAGLGILKAGKKVACSYCPDFPKNLRQSNTIDHGWAMVEYHRGAKANLGLCMFLRPPTEIWRGLEFGLVGDNGKMLIGNVDFGRMTLYGGPKKEITKKIRNPYQGQWHSGMIEEHKAFLNAIQTGKKSIETVRWGYDAVLLASAAEQSAKMGKIISV